MLAWTRDAQPEPQLLVLPAAAVSLDEAHAAIDLWEFYSGKTLDPPQRLMVEIMMATDAEDRWAAGTTGREEPRQQGKGEEIEVPEFWGVVKLHEAILHTVQEAVLLTQQAQERMLSLFDHRDLRHLIEGPKAKVWQGVGQQMIRLETGGTIWHRTRSGAGGGGRGVDKIDRLVIDEAQHATDVQLANVTSTLMQAPDPQRNIIGTAGLEGKSEWWWSIRKRALSDDPGAFGYMGHTAERVSMDENGRVEQQPVDVQDRSRWLLVNPASFHGRPAGRDQAMAFLEEELRTLGEARFAEEHLCVWAPYPGQDGGLLPFDIWAELAVPAPKKMTQVCYGMSVARDGVAACVASAARLPSGDVYVDTVTYRSGTDWLVADVAERWGRKKIPVRVLPGATEGAFVRELTERGVGVVEVPSRSYQQTCGEFLDRVKNRTVRHLDGQVELDRAVRAAQRRDVGKDGGWVWSDPLSGEDLSPLRAATLALSGVAAEPPDRSAINNIW